MTGRPYTLTILLNRLRVHCIVHMCSWSAEQPMTLLIDLIEIAVPSTPRAKHDMRVSILWVGRV